MLWWILFAPGWPVKYHVLWLVLFFSLCKYLLGNKLLCQLIHIVLLPRNRVTRRYNFWVSTYLDCEIWLFFFLCIFFSCAIIPILPFIQTIFAFGKNAIGNFKQMLSKRQHSLQFWRKSNRLYKQHMPSRQHWFYRLTILFLRHFSIFQIYLNKKNYFYKVLSKCMSKKWFYTLFVYEKREKKIQRATCHNFSAILKFDINF